MGFSQLLGAFVAAHFNRLAADPDLDGVVIQFVVACCTSLLRHILLLEHPEVSG